MIDHFALRNNGQGAGETGTRRGIDCLGRKRNRKRRHAPRGSTPSAILIAGKRPPIGSAYVRLSVLAADLGSRTAQESCCVPLYEHLTELVAFLGDRRNLRIVRH